MANVKQEYINKSYNALINYQQNYVAQRNRFQNANYGVNTPVDAKELDDVPGGKVVLSQQVFEELLKVNDEAETLRKDDRINELIGEYHK